jgi:hypothetical protein
MMVGWVVWAWLAWSAGVSSPVARNEKYAFRCLVFFVMGCGWPNHGCADFRDETGRPWEKVKTVNIPGAVRRYKICRYCGKTVRTREKIEG